MNFANKALKSALKPMSFELQIDQPPPALVLMINPSSLELRFSTKISEQRVRWNDTDIPAYIFHAHHDELDSLSCSGKTAMFVSYEKGLTRVERTDTESFKNIETLLAFYRNNGTNRNPKPNKVSNPCLIESIGRVVITYNGFVYKGHFLSFSWSENDSTPFNIDYSFDFKITNTFDSNSISNNSVTGSSGSMLLQ